MKLLPALLGLWLLAAPFAQAAGTTATAKADADADTDPMLQLAQQNACMT